MGHKLAPNFLQVLLEDVPLWQYGMSFDTFYLDRLVTMV